MKIAITTLSFKAYGGATYLKKLLPALAALDKDNQYFILVAPSKLATYQVVQDNFYFIPCPVGDKSALLRMLWEQFVLPFKLKSLSVDLIYTANNVGLFFANTKVVVAVRNMEPFCFSNYKNHWRLNVRSAFLNLLSRWSLKRATRVIAVSNFVKEFVINKYKTKPDKVKLVYHGGPNRNKAEQTSEKSNLAKFNLKPTFIFSASKFIAYANQLNLLQSYYLLKQQRMDLPQLVLAGGIADKKYYQQVMDFILAKGLTADIVLLGLVDAETMTYLYQTCQLFVYPTTLEACPNTLLEAMSYGCVIATSNLGPMPEIANEAALYFEPDNPQGIAEKINLALSDQSVRAKLRQTALQRVKDFNWTKTAWETKQVFEGINKNG